MLFKGIFGKIKRDEREVKTVDDQEIGRKFCIEIKNLSLWIGDSKESIQILKNINVRIPEHSVVAIIGPSGSGKSSLLRAINRTNFGGEYRYEGTVDYYGKNVLNKRYPAEYLRTQIGTVVQKPVMFPMSIRENILFALKSHGMTCPQKLEEILEKSLREAHLWDEVKDRLNSRPEETLSLGQQQRLCIARAISLESKVLLMDEPTSALDQKASRKIEELIKRIIKRKTSTIVIVSHSLAQVKRISDYTIFVKNGVVVEQGRTKNLLVNPSNQETKVFIAESD